ncbi:MAG: tRNA (guanosine(37)-N1)-methyltransferase TrmD [Gammaproteobacteria bacterium]|nr:tRNA (guanosine(37)-N1)-methyltransferase TrmD [Gammaproteobacteria bacterium]
MRIDVITLFPQMFSAVTEHGVTGRAVERGLLQVQTWNPRDFATDNYRTVDDRPYGGGPGMVMMVEPLKQAIQAARQELPEAKVIYLSPQGKPLQQENLQQLASEQNLILIAGRYEGIDERLIETEVDEEWSIGDYVLSGGELPAMVMMDGVARLLPGVLGHKDSAVEDSFVDGLLDCPHYTRPEQMNGFRVPTVLTSGDHKAIARWRLKQSLGRTYERRPDLLERLQLTPEQQALLQEYLDEQKQNTDT